MAELNFKNKWNLWYHHTKDDWSINGYRKIYQITKASNFWELYHNWELLGGLTYKQFFLMKNDIQPIWEDEHNKNGGCWSFKIDEKNINEIWEQLSILLVTEELLNENNDQNLIVGLSICLKKNNFCVIKIWNSDSNFNSIKLINSKILKKWGLDLIYISNTPDE